MTKTEFGSKLSNIVIMGMGEPLLNYENTIEAINIITSEGGLGFSPRRITLSTAGLPDGIKRLANDGFKAGLAISLHSADENIRSSIMPVNKSNGLDDLREAIAYFSKKTNSRITVEYLMLKGVNDRLSDAEKLAEFCKAFPSKINIIEFNEFENVHFRKSPGPSVTAFVQFLESRNMIVNVRRSRGKDIDAACGQLANKER
jgi:23S rRNA (adenine2503-C2)-methyltransferase